MKTTEQKNGKLQENGKNERVLDIYTKMAKKIGNKPAADLMHFIENFDFQTNTVTITQILHIYYKKKMHEFAGNKIDSTGKIFQISKEGKAFLEHFFTNLGFKIQFS